MAVVILASWVSSTAASLLLIPPLAAHWLRPQAYAQPLAADETSASGNAH